jgi:hypothetical protein
MVLQIKPQSLSLYLSQLIIQCFRTAFNAMQSEVLTVSLNKALINKKNTTNNLLPLRCHSLITLYKSLPSNETAEQVTNTYLHFEAGHVHLSKDNRGRTNGKKGFCT